MSAPDVLIIDDHPLVLEFLAAAVQKALPEAAVRTAVNLDRALETLRDCPADLVVLDLGLPGCGGLESLLRLRRAFPSTRVVIVSSEDGPNLIRGALAAGAAGFIPKTVKPNVIVSALRLVAEGGNYVPLEVLAAGAGAPAEPKDTLTSRQRHVLGLMLKGQSNAQIAKELGITEATAKQHAHAVYAAFGVSSRADLLLAIPGRPAQAG